ncbi:MAG: MFS transporter [Oscillospiraceae bacterium]|nr:MFS transporter [Oscillospiraceae bacterium]
MLNNKKKEFLYALSVFGPNLVFTMLLAYFTSAVNPQNLREDIALWAWMQEGGIYAVPIVMTSIFGLLFTVGRVFDALIDIPLAAKLDRMKNKYARLRLPILISIVPLVGGAIALCFPLTLTPNSALNTIWFFIALIVFFSAYTLVMVAFYSGLSSICKDRAQRARVAYFKSFIDTVQFASAYAVAPLILSALRGTGLNIMHIILFTIPLMATLFIPLLLSKGHKDTEENSELNNEIREATAKISILSSLSFVMKNKAFWPWMVVVFIYFMGLQLFLTMQNELISGVLQLPAQYAALLNAAAFGPVPIMLYFYNKLTRKKGIRFALQMSTLSFAVGILCFSLGSAMFFPDSIVPRIVINIIGGTISSFSIGAFFMMVLMIPSQVASVELKVLKRRNSAMYFAGQGIVIGIAGAIATGLIADTSLRGIGEIFVYTNMPGIEGGMYNIPLGGFITPFIVSALCLISFGMAFFMPKSYDTKTIGKLFDANYVPDSEDLADSEIVGEKVDAGG